MSGLAAPPVDMEIQNVKFKTHNIFNWAPAERSPPLVAPLGPPLDLTLDTGGHSTIQMTMTMTMQITFSGDGDDKTMYQPHFTENIQHRWVILILAAPTVVTECPWPLTPV